jgi:hypothetical protein
MTNNNYPQDIVELIKRLEGRIESLERRPRANLTTIDNGAIVAVDTDGSPLFVAGTHQMYNTYPGTTFRGTAFYRTGPGGSTPGNAVMTVGYNDGGALPDVIRVYDKNSYNIFADDVLSGGLARPYIPSSFIVTDPTKWPVTTSATFQNVQECLYIVQHPYVYVDYRLYANNADTSAELRLLSDGVQIGTTQTYDVGTGPGTVKQDFITAQLIPTTKNPYDSAVLTIEIRRTAGTGNVYGIAGNVYGRQT